MKSMFYFHCCSLTPNLLTTFITTTVSNSLLPTLTDSKPDICSFVSVWFNTQQLKILYSVQVVQCEIRITILLQIQNPLLKLLGSIIAQISEKIFRHTLFSAKPYAPTTLCYKKRSAIF